MAILQQSSVSNTEDKDSLNCRLSVYTRRRLTMQ